MTQNTEQKTLTGNHIQQKNLMNSKHFLGFYSLHDFISSLFGAKDWIVNATIATIAAITTFITGYMWDNAAAVWTLWALMGADWLTGIVKSFKNKTFVSYKLWRMPLFFIATSFLLSISWWIEKGSVLFYLLPAVVLAGFYSVYFVSLLENLGELGLLPKTLVNALKEKFGLKVLIDKYFKKEEEKKESPNEDPEV